MRFELMTSSLPRRRSTPELRGPLTEDSGAGDEIRTRDPQLGRLMLYQLSYTRSNIRIADFELRILTSQFKFEIRNSNSEIPLWCRGQDSNLRRA
jgi:hypothetical protein